MVGWNSSLVAYSALKVLTPAYYALGDARTPMLISLGSIVVNYVVAFTMIRVVGMGAAGLALTTAAVALFGFLVQFVLMKNRIGGIHGRALLAQFLKVGDPFHEMERISQDESFLRDIASSTGGKYFTLNEAPRILNIIDRKFFKRESRKETPVASSPWYFGILFALCCVEWTLRRGRRLI